MAMPTFCAGSLDFIPGIASPVECGFARGDETISQQVMFLVKALANLKRHDWFRVARIPFVEDLVTYEAPMHFRSIIALVLSTLCIASSACVAVKPGVDTSGDRAEHEAIAKDLRKRAQEGNVTAQNGLGLLYEVGQGVPQSYGQAKKWFEEAAKQGHTEAQVNLGTLYLHGNAPPQSAQMALFWFSRAAEQGDVTAFKNLGVMYAEAQGVPQDSIQAYMWFLLAATHGDENSAERCRVLAIKMTSAQIAEAEERARAWKPTSKSLAWKAQRLSDTVLLTDLPPR
jgi:Sel1 repeat-containing protein